MCGQELLTKCTLEEFAEVVHTSTSAETHGMVSSLAKSLNC